MFTKRIMLLSHEMTYTGAPNSLLNMAILLRRKGFEVSVYTQHSGSFIREFHKFVFRVKFCDPDIFDYNILKNYDLVIANTVFCGKFALRAQEYVPTILYIREAQNLPEIIDSCRLSDDYINNSRNIVCVSEYAEAFIKSNYHINNLYVIHNFINRPILFRRRNNSTSDGKVHFLIAATIERRKGIVTALDAVHMMPNELKDRMVMHIAGRKPEWASEYWKSLDLENDTDIVYHGEIEDKREMRKLYERVNCIVVPSYDESCSLSALEGAMYGRALILSRNVGSKYILDNNGIVFETGSAESLCMAMTDIIKRAGMLSEMGSISYRMFCKTSSAEVYYKNFLGIMTEVLIEEGKKLCNQIYR